MLPFICLCKYKTTTMIYLGFLLRFLIELLTSICFFLTSGRIIMTKDRLPGIGSFLKFINPRHRALISCRSPTDKHYVDDKRLLKWRIRIRILIYLSYFGYLYENIYALFLWASLEADLNSIFCCLDFKQIQLLKVRKRRKNVEKEKKII